MKRILWLSNIRFSVEDLKATGTWLQPLAESMSCLYKIFHVCNGKVNEIVYEDVGEITQIVLPNRKTVGRTQIPDKTTCDDVRRIVEKIRPDLIHVWGTESKWAYMNFLGVFSDFKTLLDMQGYLQACYKSYYGGLSFTEVLRCIGVKEILLPNRSLIVQKQLFRRKADVEKIILDSYENISTQSDWVYKQLKGLQLKAKLFHTKIMIRPLFFESKWMPTGNTSPCIFTGMSNAVSYKGLHVLLKSCALIKQKYADFKLFIVGRVMVKSHHILSGYENYLSFLISSLGITNNVYFLGSLSAEEMIRYQLMSDVCAVPSAVESYCLFLAEALAMGMPSVASYSAAMPTIAKDKEEVLFYNHLDYVDCAEKIMQLFEDKELAVSLSLRARNKRVEENTCESVIEAQKSIYESLIGF